MEEMTEQKEREKMYTTRTAAKALGVKQDTVKHYALRFGIGFQPGGSGTPWLFTRSDLAAIRKCVVDLSQRFGSVRRYARIEESEDRGELGLGPMYNEDFSPIKS